MKTPNHQNVSGAGLRPSPPPGKLLGVKTQMQIHQRMNKQTRRVCLLLFRYTLVAFIITTALNLRGQLATSSKEEPIVKASTVWSATGIKPGGEITLGVVLEIRRPYHINPSKTKEGFVPTVIEIAEAPGELRTSTPIFPPPETIDFGQGSATEKIQVFSGRTVIFIPMALTGSAKPGLHQLKIKVSYQACDEKQCLFPTSLSATAGLNIVEATATVETAETALFAEVEKLKARLKIAFFGWDFEIRPSNWLMLLLMAMIGGSLLNFTPCVLPLIPIKIIGLAKSAGNRRRCFLLGLTLSFGVVAFWLALATAISTISGFNATNKLFQFPAFTIGVGIIISAMAVGMCGFFSVNLPTWIYRINPSQETIGGSFLFGIMTAVLSTPCTAPFMGAAAAWSATQTPVITLSTFGAIGIGMALPYLILSAFPVLANRMPRAGPASELIKQVMGLLMLAAGAYFLGTGLAGLLAKPPDPPTQAYWWIVTFFIAAAGAWMTWRTIRITPGVAKRIIFGTLGLLIVVIAIWIGVRFTRSSPIHWVYYTPERLADAQRQGKIVVLEFTAAWCLNCHALEQTVLHDPRVVRVLNSEKVAPIKVDITGNNPDGNQKLIEVGRRSIPYLVVYSLDGKVVFSSDAYTIEQVVEAVDRPIP
jgi:thiol:disulfide interchange protein